MTADLPLAGLKIVITRPRDQAMHLARSIERAGGQPLLFPLLEIEGTPDSAMLRQQVARLAQFDLAVFISPNAVRYGMAAIHAHGALPGQLKIATVGQGSARALRELGVAEVIAPCERFDSEGLLALPELQQVAGWRVLIFRGEHGRELLGDTLTARGATVEYASCYRRTTPPLDIGALLASGPDAIAVTSSEALQYLGRLAAEHADVLHALPLFVPHARIAELAHQQGWRQVNLAGSGDEGLFSALQEWAGSKTGPAHRTAHVAVR